MLGLLCQAGRLPSQQPPNASRIHAESTSKLMIFILQNYQINTNNLNNAYCIIPIPIKLFQFNLIWSIYKRTMRAVFPMVLRFLYKSKRNFWSYMMKFQIRHSVTNQSRGFGGLFTCGWLQSSFIKVNLWKWYFLSRLVHVVLHLKKINNVNNFRYNKIEKAMDFLKFL